MIMRCSCWRQKNEMHQELMAFEDTPIEEVKFASIPIVSSYKISTLLSEFQKVIKIAGRSLIIIFWKKNRKTY